MSKIAILSVFVVMLLAVLPYGASAQSIDLKTALARMSVIIAEMEKLRSEFSTLAATTGQTPAPAVLGAQTSSKPVFTLSLEVGETNEDIARIQKLLATDPEIYPYGVSSGFFGPKTEEAIKNLQARNGWNAVGVVGPSTRALLEAYFKAYPDEKFPADVLKSKPPAPKVLGISVSTPTTPTVNQPVAGTNLAKSINVKIEDGESLIEINYANGNRKGMVADTEDKEEVVKHIASHTVLTEAMIREMIAYDGRSSNSGSTDTDEDEAETALDDAEDALDEADEAIAEAEEDGDDVDWAEDTLDEADDLFRDAEDAFDDEDYEEALELAKKAEKMAKKAEDRIDEEEDEDEDDDKGDADDIDKIEVEIGDGESEVTVTYEDDEEDDFTVDEDKEDDIIEAIAEELDIDEDDVEDLIEFDYGDVDEIVVTIDEDKGTALARVMYESGAERRVRLTTTDEDEIIEDVAKEIDEDEEDVEDWIEFD